MYFDYLSLPVIVLSLNEMGNIYESSSQGEMK